MKLATRYILKAWIIENILAIITYYSVVFLMVEDFFHKIFDSFLFVMLFFVINMILVIPLICLVGQKINYSKIEEGVRFFFGIILIFVLLTISFSLGGLISYLIYEFKLLSYSEWLNIAVTFYLFGGLQTLCVGVWLGYKLSGLKS
ncbi:hypothetical protein CAPN006_21620 [Capnocytophaga canimorsus]|uniref:hypothetical protein n=1 Tax=Capnocytophaga canimorsus TaxID=28188 RepID=UPI001AC52F2A|nr:hypothetical protein [Capnocytophaga canimorsus]GIM57770.1 hypothetical protein CAPN006_21620 [Capnocytophaga canimorsus]